MEMVAEYDDDDCEENLKPSLAPTLQEQMIANPFFTPLDSNVYTSKTVLLISQIAQSDAKQMENVVKFIGQKYNDVDAPTLLKVFGCVVPFFLQNEAIFQSTFDICAQVYEKGYRDPTLVQCFCPWLKVALTFSPDFAEKSIKETIRALLLNLDTSITPQPEKMLASISALRAIATRLGYNFLSFLNFLPREFTALPIVVQARLSEMCAAACLLHDPARLHNVMPEFVNFASNDATAARRHGQALARLTCVAATAERRKTQREKRCTD